MKKMNNNGFSLIELIIVVTMMAIMTAILVPQMMKHVEASRVQKDETLLDDIRNAANIVLSSGGVYDEVVSNEAIIYIKEGEKVTANNSIVQAELQKGFPDVVNFSSKKYSSRGGESIAVAFSDPHGTFVLTCSWKTED